MNTMKMHRGKSQGGKDLKLFLSFFLRRMGWHFIIICLLLAVMGNTKVLGEDNPGISLIPPSFLSVDTIVDENDGNLSPGDISLREAIQVIAPDGVIDFDLAPTSDTIILNVGLGDLVIEKDMTITGPGAGNLSIDGGNSTRVFFIKTGIVTIQDLTIKGGQALGGPGIEGGGGAGGMGGAIFVNTGAHLILENVDFSENSAIGGLGGNADSPMSGGGGGGGISGPGNPSLGPQGGSGGPGDPLGGVPGPGGLGGGIFPAPPDGQPGGPGGEGTGGGGGGAGYISYVPGPGGMGGDGGPGGFGGGGGRGGAGAPSTDPYIPGGMGGMGGFGGFAGGGGAGGLSAPSSPVPIEMGGISPLPLPPPVIPGGLSAGFGGKGGDTFFSPSGGGGGAGLGGAIFVREGAMLSISDCFFTTNTATGGPPGIGFDPFYEGEPGQGKGGALFIQDGAIVINNGGLSFYGDEASDDLGYINDNDDVYGMTITGDVIVTILFDEDDGNYAPDDISLREAIFLVQTGGTIRFDPTLFTPTGTITLSLGELNINKDGITIEGQGANVLSINGNLSQRVFNITGMYVNLSGMNITNGLHGYGGGIRADSVAIVTINLCSITLNTAGLQGGGIYNLGEMSIYNSTISGNYINDDPIPGGGGIYNEGRLVMTNCTVSGNSDTFNLGGGILNVGGPNSNGVGLNNSYGTMDITNCTITGNSALDAGGVYNSGGIVNVKNSLIAGNNTTIPLNPDALGVFNSNGYNIIGNPGTSTGWLTTDIKYVSASSAIDTVLQDNGGPTLTHAVIPCGLAFDAGDNDEVTTPTFLPPPYTDQQGMPRIYNNTVDIGAYELHPETPRIAVGPDFINFGQHSVNKGPSAPQSVTIKNKGTAALQFSNISLGDTTNFTFPTTPDSSDLGMCLSRTIDVAFDPASIGVFTTTLEIVSNDPISPTISVELQGEGVNLPPEAIACTGNPYSLDFNGTSDYINCGNNSVLMPTSQLTVEAWINADAWASSTWGGTIVSRLYNYYSYGWYRFGYALRVGDSGTLEFIIANNANNWRNIFTPPIMLTHQWYHIAGVYDGNNLIVYINGVPQNSLDDQAPPGIRYSSYPLFIGECPLYYGRKFNGLIDELRIWNVARSQTDIQNNMNRTMDADETGLVGYWRFDEGSGNIAFDSSDYTNNATLYGMPDWVTDIPDIKYYEGFLTTEDDIDTTITICGIDPDGDPLWGVITSLPITGTGDLYQYAGIGPIRGAIIDSVPTSLTDPDRNTVYAPVDLTINYNTFIRGKVNDGTEDSPNEITYTITVLDNDAPVLVNNVPQSLAKGDTLLYTSPTLYATDFEDIPENITYTLTTPPTHGVLWLDIMELEQYDAFTQADIDAGMLSYVHSSIGMAQENFSYNLTDGAGLVTGPYTSTINILFTPAPQVYVDLNSPGSILDGGSWASAHHSLAIGVLDAEALGLTEVWVADGTYLEEVDMRSGVHALAGFEGYGGAEETMASQRDWINNICIVEGPEHGRAFTLGDISNSMAHGFVITGSGISCGGCDDTNLITHCVIRENTAQFGAGIFMNGSSVQITECMIMDNAATRQGGGIYMRNSSMPIIKNCVISGNTAEEEGGAFYCRNKEEPRIVNCVIANNEATHGGAMYVRQNSTPLILNSTVSGNSASTAGGGIFCDNDGTPIAANSIFEDNDNFAIYEGDDTANASLMNCLFWENPDGAFRNSDGTEYMDADVADLNNDIPEAMDNLTGDPWFVDKPMNDFHLRACSAALDEGIPNQAPLDDKDGNIRPYDLPGIGIDGPGQGFDIGAYELYTTGTKIAVTPLLLPFGAQPVNQGPTDPQTVTILNEGIEILEIDSIEFNGVGAFFLTAPLDESDMAICEQRDIGIVFDPSEIESTTGTIVIRSNDPQNPEITVILTGNGVNTPPVAGVPGPGGDQFVANTDEDTPIVISVTGYDDDGDDLTAWVTQIPDLGKGAIHQYQGPGPIPGPRITSVPTQVTDPDWRLVYVPDGAVAQYDAIVKWKMNDGYTDSLNRGTFTITVLADDDPAVLVNSSMTVEEAATELVTPADLLATGDYPVSFRLDSLPSLGDLLMNSVPLSIDGTFTQDDIALGLVSYSHDGSNELADSFIFSFKDLNSDWITTNTFTITVELVNDPPVLVWNRSLLVDEGGIGGILQTHLLVEDEESAPAEIIYSVGTFPVNGDLYLDGTLMSSGGIETFTQADIDAGLLSYMHDGGSMDPDEFTFTFTDGEFNLGPDTFAITISFSDRKGAWWMMR